MSSNGSEHPEERHDGGEGTPEEATEAPTSHDRRAEELQARIDELETTLSLTEGKLADTEARLRAVSKAYTDQRNEMAAFRERLEAQERVRVERKEFEVVETFFEPVENLHRSIEAGIAEPASFLEGVRMIHHQFMQALHRLGLEEVPGEGAPFDPQVHEALAVTPVDDPAQDEKVVAVHVRGWRVGGKVLRAAQVVIGRHQAQVEPAEA